jgi:glycosyltransferase involved in cell wall biosynthesis
MKNVTQSGERKFSIIIPTWNNLEYLKLCIDSINKNSHFNHQIILHINEGLDGTKEWAEKSGIDFSYSSHNAGVCYGMNSARTLVETDYILYMNDDMYVCPDWDLYLWEEIEKIGHLYFFLSATMIERPLKSGNVAVILADYGDSYNTFEEKKLLQEFSQLEKGDWNGATRPPNIVHKQIWDLVGGYSIEFFPGMYSDPDFSMKLYNAGIRIFKGVGKSRVYHFVSKSIEKLNSKNNGRHQFIQKWKMSANTFYFKWLKIGTPYSGEISEANNKIDLLEQVENWIKRKIWS